MNLFFPSSMVSAAAYLKVLGDAKQENRDFSVRLVFGSLIIQERRVFSNEETVPAIMDNPYMQYFIGLHTFQGKASFNLSSLPYFRKNFNTEFINELNQSGTSAQPKRKIRKTVFTIRQVEIM